jgi:DNA-binding transcriptional LysR family regulator
VRHGSVTRAAEELSLAQPTVSCLIRKLNDTVGTRVLHTRGRRVEPTATGRELLVLCEEIFRSFDRFDERVAQQADPLLPARERGTLAGALSSLA